ncbi:uncharacterized protein SCHCODRAFT_02635990 [Schizophyllum commune H4-8]|uniref:uncharacterized protein n=1 Tax=Schizophyllum commune (strain H4-8 / FGSC 9210) TaxID=578458 RepID=UPI00215FA419|nr:uncharacterized protein SCHCODRAFT_02635990 [Schizophyllum commune H4-8]KAI5888190.1 hypothetical protein SCHCODRAFT_02635990 [Schizophyllum commune H4-8]
MAAVALDIVCHSSLLCMPLIYVYAYAHASARRERRLQAIHEVQTPNLKQPRVHWVVGELQP